MPEVVRVSILRCDPERLAEVHRMMVEAEPALAPGIQALNGLIQFWAGADDETSSLNSVSVWRTLDDGKQLGTFQPMLDPGKKFAERGARFERPITNYDTLWTIEE